MMMLVLAFGLYGALAWFMSNLYEEEPALAHDNVIVRRSN
jgi:hypothetical protein